MDWEDVAGHDIQSMMSMSWLRYNPGNSKHEPLWLRVIIMPAFKKILKFSGVLLVVVVLVGGLFLAHSWYF